MASNGRHRPSRPRIDIAAAASDDEAAAIAAALERFLIETAPAPGGGPPPSRWLGTALAEGVSREPTANAWGPRIG
jgi:hypothetical protein